MRTPMRLKGVAPLFLIALCAINFNMGCGDTASDNNGNTYTDSFPLSECSVVTDCEIADHARFFLDIYGPDGLGVIDEAQANEIAECLGDGVCADDGYCRIPDFSLECITLLPGMPGDACYNDLACEDDNVCTEDSCVASRCVSTPVEDPSPDPDEGNCTDRACDPIDGWEDIPVREGLICGDDGGECISIAACDAGTCVEGTPEAYALAVASVEAGESDMSDYCCLSAGSCPEACSSLRYCTEEVGESDFGRCGCEGADLASEVCDDELDNDGDGDFDCEDTDCEEADVCLISVPSETGACNDGLDNDGDLLVDCADPDCTDLPRCDAEEICDDEVDNDFDGDFDCADSDCADDPACDVEPPTPTTETSCDDSVDNDGDLLVDCADSDCDGDEACSDDPVTPEPEQLELGETQGVICWAVGNAETGANPGRIIRTMGPFPDIASFEPLCTGFRTDLPVRHVLCVRYRELSDGSFDDSVAGRPFFADQGFVVAPIEPGAGGAGSAGYESTLEVCGRAPDLYTPE